MKLVETDHLKKGMVLAREVFAPNVRNHPLIRKNSVLNQESIERIMERGITSVYIKEEWEMEDLSAQTEADAQSDFDTSHHSAKALPVLSPKLQERALDSLESFFTLATKTQREIHASSALVIKQLAKVVTQLVDSLLRYRGTMVNISNLKSYDEYTYHHSLSVAVLSIAIAQHMKMDKDELNRVGMCAMMHDIGKVAMPLNIIQKPSHLDNDELSIMKAHSLAGYDYLKKNGIGDEELWRVILFHHEKMDGTGYPMGITGDKIPLISRIISVADVYDALTSNRPYREPMQPSEAIEYIMGGAGSSFDFEIVTAFTKKLELYPVGNCVELSTQELAMVLNNENPMRPVVRLIDTGEIIDLHRDRSFLNVVINRVLHDVDLPQEA